jgi:hypothetical protein
MRRLLALAIPVLFTAACGSSPTSPSIAAGSGARINGAIVASGWGAAGLSRVGTGAASSTSVPAGLIVTVAGTDLSAPVDGAGTFSLQDVPAGDVDLRFSSPTVNGNVLLDDVQASQTIDIAVSVDDTTVALESQARSLGGDTELEGRIEEFPELTAEDDLVVGGRLVLTDEDTTFYFGNTEGEFEDLQIGWRVHVKGTTSGDELLASVIMVQNTNPDIQYPINGIIEGFSGTEDAFEFTIGRHLIKGDADTEFFGNTTFEDIADGEFAVVKSLLRDGFFYALRLHIENDEEDDDDEEQEESASVEGLLEGLGGVAPDLTFMVGTTMVTTTGTTIVQRKGDVQTLEELAEGMTVHVVGDRQPDGSLIARRVQIKDDEVGGAFQIEGALGGLSGTCPTVSFGVNGYAIVTDAATVYDPAAPGCSGLKPGNKVRVDGIVQADGTVLATLITS